MIPNTATGILPYRDRLTLASAQLNRRWDERGQFLSDSDILDAADNWSDPDRTDYNRLVDDLYALHTAPDDE